MISLRLFLLLPVLAAAPGWMPAALAQKPQPIVVIDRIVAVVNEEVITRNDLQERTQHAFAQLRRQGTPLPPRDVLEKQILDRMITDRVQLQFAKETGMRVDDNELDRALGRIAEENKLTLAQLRAAVEKDGVPYAKFREDIRSEIITVRLREREVDNRIVVTDGEIDNFLNSPQTTVGGNEFDLSHILVTVPESASPEQIQSRRARAEQALAQLKSGTDFRQVAASFSDAPDALSGGAMGWRDANRLPTLFVEALQKMRPGEVTELLRSPNGFHLLRLNNRRGASASAVMVQQTRAQHILIKTNELVSEDEARRRLVGLKERLDNKADFAELARTHSEDASSVKGGDLGWLTPGDTVPEFERAMNALKPGETSDPVKSPFGWHLIHVNERRSEDMSKERQRLDARMALRARKSDESYQEWVRQLRDRAYIEYRLEER